MLIIYNPHVDDFLAEPLQFRLLKRRPLKKYGFLIDEARARKQTVSVLIDGTASGLIPETIFQRFPKLIRHIMSRLEFKLWKKINGFGDEVRLVAPAMSGSSDILLAFSYKAATGNFALRKSLLSRYRAVVFHLSHYFLATNEKSNNIRMLNNAVLAGDSDIRDIPYFKKYFSWYNRPFLILPFAVADRFSIKKSWDKRDPRVVATGSFHDLSVEQPAYKYTDFITSTGSTTYHPVRKEIFESSTSLEHIINCKTSVYRQYTTGRLKRFMSHFLVSQKKYFSVNIVDLYNNHKFAVVGEELSGFPALGALEAIACGCVLLAQPQYYVGLGLVPGYHYLVYSGAVADLTMKAIEANQLPLEDLAKSGSEFVNSKFNPIKIFEMWHKACSLDDIKCMEH